jgi:hypothetical protein
MTSPRITVTGAELDEVYGSETNRRINTIPPTPKVRKITVRYAQMMTVTSIC